MMAHSENPERPLTWVADTTTGQVPEYLTDVRAEVIEYVNQVDRHTLRLLQKFIRSLERT